jgi:hypothetical protein
MSARLVPEMIKDCARGLRVCARGQCGLCQRSVRFVPEVIEIGAKG